MRIQARKTVLEKYTTINAANDEYYLYLKNAANSVILKSL